MDIWFCFARPGCNFTIERGIFKLLGTNVCYNETLCLAQEPGYSQKGQGHTLASKVTIFACPVCNFAMERGILILVTNVCLSYLQRPIAFEDIHVFSLNVFCVENF